MTATDVFKLEFPYRRSLGPVIGAFLTGLRDAKALGIRRPDGRVLCPPLEYDPETGDALSELVEVGPGGVVHDWAWVTQPLRNHPFDRPFAWVLVQLDGADSALFHALDAGSIDRVARGLRVQIRWRDASERKGHITDIAGFEPEAK